MKDQILEYLCYNDAEWVWLSDLEDIFTTHQDSQTLCEFWLALQELRVKGVITVENDVGLIPTIKESGTRVYLKLPIRGNGCNHRCNG